MPHRLRFPLPVALGILFFHVAPVSLEAQCEADHCTGPGVAASSSCHRSGSWFVLDTENFCICCCDSSASAKQLAQVAEKLRTELRTKWLDDQAIDPWNPRCQIVLHPNVRSYVSAAGRGSEHTVGCSTVKVAEGRVTYRRVDLLAERKDFLSGALPHELTHVVLKDRFISTDVPRWADEGMAILADSQAKQGGHLSDLRNAVSRRIAFHTAALVRIDEYPAADRVGAFYGQSASMAKFLVDRKSPKQFVNFIEQSVLKGYDNALKDCYEIQGVSDLERLWRQSLRPIHLASLGEQRRP